MFPQKLMNNILKQNDSKCKETALLRISSPCRIAGVRMGGMDPIPTYKIKYHIYIALCPY